MEAIIESKSDEIQKKVEEIIESKSEEIQKKADEIEVKIEETVEKVADDIQKKIEDILPDQLEKIIESNLVEVIDGRVFSCSCFGLLWSLRITRKSPPTLPSKSEETRNTKKPGPPLKIRTPV